MNNRVQKDYIEFVGEWKKNTTKGDVQGTAGAGQKRKRTTATPKKKKRKPSADEDMDVDEEERDSDDDYEEAPKPKKVSSKKTATQKAALSASTSISSSKPSSPRVKTEFDSISNTLQSTLISSSNLPSVDRLAALRKASQNQAARAVQVANSAGSRGTLPTRTESVNDNDKSASITRTNPQMLPSPAQGFVVPATVSESLSAIHRNAVPPPPATGSSTNSSARASFMELFNCLPPGSPGPHDLPRIAAPVAPLLPQRPAGIVPSLGEWDRRGGYDDRDHESHRLYDNHNHRRDSGNFGGNYVQHLPDDRERGRGPPMSGSGGWR